MADPKYDVEASIDTVNDTNSRRGHPVDNGVSSFGSCHLKLRAAMPQEPLPLLRVGESACAPSSLRLSTRGALGYMEIPIDRRGSKKT